ncbi:MAG: hypothetical protein QM820_28485 [Minicystis sp.]
MRAYEAMLDAGSAPVYRQKADRAEVSEQASVAAWVGRFAPNAAPFVRSAPIEAKENAAPAKAERAPSEEAKRKIEAARPVFKPANNGTKTLAIWVLLILAFLAVWSAGISWLPPVAILLGGGGFVAWIVRGIRRNRAEARRLREAVRAFGVGEVERAAEALAFEPKGALHRMQAAHFRAEIAITRGRMAEALTEIDKAFAALAEAQGGKVQEPAKPAADRVMVWDFQRILAAQRALALAALGRGDEARAEIAWANGFPTPLPELRVDLIERLATHDFAAALRVVEGAGPDLVPAAHDEALFDLIRFVARPAARSEGEAARIRADLRRTPYLAAFVAAVAPGLVEAFEAAAVEGAEGRQIAAVP